MNGRGEVEWTIDGKLFKKSGAGARLFWPYDSGEHLIGAKDSDGRTDTVKVVVK
ncbi:MAG TPA: hypothetical protein PK747_11135 [Acidobacteriota bacterium]|nr:hypothetical protein [Acidobacteriota bacterium]HQO19515.1 hypothetical protein [Acidobacteriota bacterium]HQQ47942.1 hypothetical protein [Acidobacteriota bacterium]